ALYGGRAVINSVNLEEGEDRADRICKLARRYGAALIALTIDERGMAKEVADKVDVAQRIYDIAVNRNGLRPHDLIFDPLTFTLGSGDETLRDSAKDTLEGISLIKRALPGVLTSVGLSNVSFGLSPHSRKILNSVFLAECVGAGLDMAIVNLSQIIPIAQIGPDDYEVAHNLVYNMSGDRSDDNETADPLFAFIDHFERKGGAAEQPVESSDESLSPDEKLSRKVIQGSKSSLRELLMESLENKSAIEIINGTLIPAMKKVGELFGSGKMQLPFVLQSAEVMKTSVDILQPFMEKREGEEQLSIVLATVRGDVHDIGKNLVEIILSNNGYKVYNLGIKVGIETMISTAVDVGASAIGMSGLLVKSTVVMKENIEELERRGIGIPVLLGGAALTPGYVYETCASLYDSPVMYCADAFEGLKGMELIKDGNLAPFVEAEKTKRASRSAVRRPAQSDALHEMLRRDIAVPKAPFLGIRKVEPVDLDVVYDYLTEEVLFRGRWGYRRGSLSKE
ncbi:MAG TPA: dihydropteroate synthase, partial [Candidatus Paceibacterota bacterium]